MSEGIQSNKTKEGLDQNKMIADAMKQKPPTGSKSPKIESGAISDQIEKVAGDLLSGCVKIFPFLFNIASNSLKLFYRDFRVNADSIAEKVTFEGKATMESFTSGFSGIIRSFRDSFKSKDKSQPKSF
jgi:hypothetical protein